MKLDKLTLALNPENKRYFGAAAGGQLLIGQCNACKRPHFYPRSLCPFCFSADTVMTPALGEGVIYSYSVTRQASPPYVIAYVTLAEGVTMLSNIVDCDPENVRIGLKVKVKFVKVNEEQSVPMFTLA